jgi:D-tagatose-1,6-bisphosphate aldolase subunit GatZ/KbaZ
MSNQITLPLWKMVIAQKEGRSEGILSICSAHPHVLRAATRLAKENTTPLLIESTCNQVNQEGGYTGMTPEQFAVFIHRVAEENDLPSEQLILGGDHLGPYPWRDHSAASALQVACRMVADYVLAGYTKIHLDASMRCADDPPDPLSKAVIAERTAELCLAAESAARQVSTGAGAICYVIGTEVPPPGGAKEEQEEIEVTAPEDVEETLQITRQAFMLRGLQAAWERVIALVVQPGVEYGDSTVHAYERDKARPLLTLIGHYDHLVYEAHSTDYQTPRALRELVEDHFAILKVGPALTFAFRQAAFALASIEQEWLADCPDVLLSHLPQELEEAMLTDPHHWRNYYQGDDRQLRFARKYSLSDRSRYYWSNPRVQESLARLFRNLEAHPVPATLLSQYLPRQSENMRQGRRLDSHPLEWVDDAVQDVLADYYFACSWEIGG